MKLLEQVRNVLRVRHYSYRTEQCYVAWIEQFIRFHRTPVGWQHPDKLGPADVERFLTYLAVDRRVSASMQNQALGSSRQWQSAAAVGRWQLAAAERSKACLVVSRISKCFSWPIASR